MAHLKAAHLKAAHTKGIWMVKGTKVRVQLDQLKEATRPLVWKHRPALVKELARLGAGGVYDLNEDQYLSFLNFLKTLEP